MKQVYKTIAKIGEKVARTAAHAASWPYCYQAKTPAALKEKQKKKQNKGKAGMI